MTTQFSAALVLPLQQVWAAAPAAVVRLSRALCPAFLLLAVNGGPTGEYQAVGAPWLAVCVGCDCGLQPSCSAESGDADGQQQGQKPRLLAASGRDLGPQLPASAQLGPTAAAPRQHDTPDPQCSPPGSSWAQHRHALGEHPNA